MLRVVHFHDSSVTSFLPSTDARIPAVTCKHITSAFNDKHVSIAVSPTCLCKSIFDQKHSLQLATNLRYIDRSHGDHLRTAWNLDHTDRSPTAFVELGRRAVHVHLNQSVVRRDRQFSCTYHNHRYTPTLNQVTLKHNHLSKSHPSNCPPTAHTSQHRPPLTNSTAPSYISHPKLHDEPTFLNTSDAKNTLSINTATRKHLKAHSHSATLHSTQSHLMSSPSPSPSPSLSRRRLQTTKQHTSHYPLNTTLTNNYSLPDTPTNIWSTDYPVTNTNSIRSALLRRYNTFRDRNTTNRVSFEPSELELDSSSFHLYTMSHSSLVFISSTSNYPRE